MEETLGLSLIGQMDTRVARIHQPNCSIYSAIFTTLQIDEIPPVIISLITF
jgi:hypothetical protein